MAACSIKHASIKVAPREHAASRETQHLATRTGCLNNGSLDRTHCRSQSGLPKTAHHEDGDLQPPDCMSRGGLRLTVGQGKSPGPRTACLVRGVADAIGKVSVLVACGVWLSSIKAYSMCQLIFLSHRYFYLYPSPFHLSLKSNKGKHTLKKEWRSCLKRKKVSYIMRLFRESKASPQEVHTNDSGRDDWLRISRG